MTATDLNSAVTTLESPVIGQIHALIAADLASGIPGLESATMGGVSTLTSNSAAFYARMKALTVEKIDQYGGPITLRRTSVSDYDVDTGVVSTLYADEFLKGVVTKIEQQSVEGNRDVQQLKVIIADVDSAPDYDDILIIGGVPYQIKKIEAVNASGEDPIAYRLFVEG